MSKYYTFTEILCSENIGDSLDTINANYANLSNWAKDIETKYNNLWKPILDFYTSNLTDINHAITVDTERSNDFINFKSNMYDITLNDFEVFVL